MMGQLPVAGTELFSGGGSINRPAVARSHKLPLFYFCKLFDNERILGASRNFPCDFFNLEDTLTKRSIRQE